MIRKLLGSLPIKFPDIQPGDCFELQIPPGYDPSAGDCDYLTARMTVNEFLSFWNDQIEFHDSPFADAAWLGVVHEDGIAIIEIPMASSRRLCQ